MIHTHIPTTRLLETWCREHLGRHDSPSYRAYMNHFAAQLSQKRCEQREPHSNGGNFGMSGAGGCVRANAMKRAGIAGKGFSGGDQATFEIGHLGECMALAILQAAGLTVEHIQAPVTYGVHQSAVDGIIRTWGPLDNTFPVPVILSVKTSAYKMGKPGQRRGFAALPLDGIAKAQPSWHVQAQLEMAATAFDGKLPVCQHTLFVVLAKDVVKAFEGDEYMAESLCWYTELVPFEASLAVNVNAEHLAALKTADSRRAPARYFTQYGFVDLPSPGDYASKWGGPNQKATGSFNPCFGCSFGGGEECKP